MTVVIDPWVLYLILFSVAVGILLIIALLALTIYELLHHFRHHRCDHWYVGGVCVNCGADLLPTQRASSASRP